MSVERAAGITISGIGAALLIIKLLTEPKIEWDWSDTGEALAFILVVIAGAIAYATGPKK